MRDLLFGNVEAESTDKKDPPMLDSPCIIPIKIFPNTLFLDKKFDSL